jgi:hypothetical protein
MLQIRRTEGREVVDAAGRSFALVSETWTIRLAAPWFGLGYSYRRPVAVEGASRSVTIRDHLVVARIAALLLLAAGALIGRRGQ